MKKVPTIAAAVAAAGMLNALNISTAHADAGDQCMPPVWIHHGWIVGSQQTCWHPDDTYTTCTSIGTTGDGPGSCTTLPGAPAPTPGNKLQIGPQ